MAESAIRRKVIGAQVTSGPSSWPTSHYERFECGACHRNVDVVDNFCRWCGVRLFSEPLSIVPAGDQEVLSV